MLFIMNRSQELDRLIGWAAKKYQSRREKKFFFIQKSYERQRDNIQRKLFFLRIRFPAQYWLAIILHRISNVLAQKPVYYARAASTYGK